jgi:hypothetical protein
MLQHKGVECVKRVAGLVTIDAIGAAGTGDVEVKILLLDARRGVDRPEGDARCDGEIGAERIDGNLFTDSVESCSCAQPDMPANARTAANNNLFIIYFIHYC